MQPVAVDQDASGGVPSGAGYGLALVALALVVTLLNAIKPVTVDDGVYYLFATHIADNPLDPYGFRALGVNDANRILAPPVFLYWWALAVRFFGHDLIYWKLWLFPFILLLVFTLHRLGRRFAAGMEMPFVCMVTLSAAVLPCINLMLDIPALALALFAVVLFLRACSRESLTWAVLAGVVAGVAAQTKYTGLIAPAVMVLYGWMFGHRRLGLVACCLPVGMFVGWELLMLRWYGDSHFWLGFTQFREPLWKKVGLAQPLLGYLGSTAAAILPLALVALGWPSRRVWAVLALVVVGFAFIALPAGPLLDFSQRFLGVYPHPAWISLGCGVIGLSLLGALAAVGRRLVSATGTGEGFLGLWLLVEIGGYFALSPYPATRRILGIVVVGTLLACRLAARTCEGRRRLVWSVAGVNCILGVALFAVDFNLYYGQRAMALEVARACRQEPGASTWFFGQAEFEFVAGRLGMRNVITPSPDFSPGDWVVVVNGFEGRYAHHPISSRCAPQCVCAWTAFLPLQSRYQFGNVAFRRDEGPHVWATLYRVQ